MVGRGHYARGHWRRCGIVEKVPQTLHRSHVSLLFDGYFVAFACNLVLFGNILVPLFPLPVPLPLTLKPIRQADDKMQAIKAHV
jgi:hypothetical protein